MNNIETNLLYTSLLNDSWTFYLSASGILISVITLLYSFIVGKRTELEAYAELSKLGNTDPIQVQRHQLVIKSIKQMKSLINNVLILLWLSLASAIISWLSLRFLPEKWHFGVVCIVLVLTLLFFVGLIVQVRKIMEQYNRDTAI